MIHFNRSKYYEPSNTLMLNFTCIAESENLDKVTDEVDYAEWFTIEEAEKHIKQDSLAHSFLKMYLEEKDNGNMKNTGLITIPFEEDFMWQIYIITKKEKGRGNSIKKLIDFSYEWNIN